VLPRGPVDQYGQGLGEGGGGRIALLLGEVGVTVQIEERHRRGPLWPSQHAGRLELVLDALDEMLGPRQLLLAAVDARQRRVHQRQEVAAQLGGQLHGGPLVGPGLQRQPLEPRLVGLGPGRASSRRPSAWARPSRVSQARSKVPLDRPSCSSGTTSSSSSRIGSSGPARANPIDSSTAPSVSSGTPVSWLTWR